VTAALRIEGLFRLDGKVAFVPGGYGGIGEAVAWGLAHHGATVAIAGRDATKAGALAAKMKEEGLTAAGFAIDMHSVASIRSGVDGVVAELGAIDILMNCVGIQREQPLVDVTEEAWDEVVDINLKAAMFTAQAVARHQIAAGRRGRHVHLLSVRALLGLRDRGYSAYCSTKGGLAMLVKQHAVELARHQITVNGIAPTVVRSEMASHWFANPVTAAAIVERIPLGRVAEPIDIVGAAIYFCAPASAFVTGQILTIDGGITASQ
jgi:NAD(P)-dependent dehydrogenase (short-subunit alcohol dehydrogenase family)